MSWKHEQPFEEMVREEMGDDPVPAHPFMNNNHETGAPAIRLFRSPPFKSGILSSSQQKQQIPDAPAPTNPLINGNYEIREAPTIIFNGAHLRDIFRCSITSLSQSGIFIRNPGDSNHLQASDALNSPQQKSPADINSTGSENGDAERSPSTPSSPPPSSGRSVLRPPAGQASRPSKRNLSHKDKQPANASLSLIHSSKVSKAAGKRKGFQRRLNISQKVSSNGLLLSSSVDAVEPQPLPPPDHVTPRRSQQIWSLISNVAKNPTKMASTGPETRVIRSNLKRNIANNPTTKGSAKPQGISKRLPAKTTRGKAKGK